MQSNALSERSLASGPFAYPALDSLASVTELGTVRPTRDMTYTASSAFTWWEARRLRYNVGLVVAGLLAFIAYAVLGSMLLSDDPDFEVTIFATFFQGIAYLFMIAPVNGSHRAWTTGFASN